jgi:hypothetical protein
MVQVWRPPTASFPRGVRRVTSPEQLPSVPVVQAVSVAATASVVAPPALPQVAAP